MEDKVLGFTIEEIQAAIDAKTAYVTVQEREFRVLSWEPVTRFATIKTKYQTLGALTIPQNLIEIIE